MKNLLWILNAALVLVLVTSCARKEANDAAPSTTSTGQVAPDEAKTREETATDSVAAPEKPAAQAAEANTKLEESKKEQGGAAPEETTADEGVPGSPSPDEPKGGESDDAAAKNKNKMAPRGGGGPDKGTGSVLVEPTAMP
jgi:hypothetical protein